VKQPRVIDLPSWNDALFLAAKNETAETAVLFVQWHTNTRLHAALALYDSKGFLLTQGVMRYEFKTQPEPASLDILKHYLQPKQSTAPSEELDWLYRQRTEFRSSGNSLESPKLPDPTKQHLLNPGRIDPSDLVVTPLLRKCFTEQPSLICIAVPDNLVVELLNAFSAPPDDPTLIIAKIQDFVDFKIEDRTILGIDKFLSASEEMRSPRLAMQHLSESLGKELRFGNRQKGKFDFELGKAGRSPYKQWYQSCLECFSQSPPEAAPSAGFPALVFVGSLDDSQWAQLVSGSTLTIAGLTPESKQALFELGSSYPAPLTGTQSWLEKTPQIRRNLGAQYASAASLTGTVSFPNKMDSCVSQLSWIHGSKPWLGHYYYIVDFIPTAVVGQVQSANPDTDQRKLLEGQWSIGEYMHGELKVFFNDIDLFLTSPVAESVTQYIPKKEFDFKDLPSDILRRMMGG